MDNDELDLPPAIPLLVTEIAPWNDRRVARKRLRALLGELRQQSEVYRSSKKRKNVKANPLEFDIHLHAGLDPLNRGGGCSQLPCRLTAADRVSRSMGLLADRVWIGDGITSRSIDFGDVTEAKLDSMIDDAQVIARLWPMIEAGIVRFRPTAINLCESCLSEFERSIRSTAAEIASNFSQEIEFEQEADGTYVARTGKLFEPPITVVHRRPPKVAPTKESILTEIIYNQVRSALWVGRDASKLGGAIFSNSRIGLAGLLRHEGRLGGVGQLMALDNERSLKVPWVSELTPSQILQLRQEASGALPLFREKFARALSVGESADDYSSAARELVMELREQSHEVRAELQAAQKNSAKYWKTTYALLGLGLSAYGVATDQVVAGVGGLLPLINLLISHKSGHEKDISKLTTKPGYVLVKAQDILAHAD